MMTNGYQVSVPSASTSTLTFDANGNMTSDGTNTYSWDAENRLLRVTYPGTGSNSQFNYDPRGKNVQILEYSGGSLTTTRQFVYSSNNRCEARDSSSTVIARYFTRGQTISTTNYLYTKDHIGSIREMTNSSGTVEAQYSYDPNGQATKLQGSLASDLQYAGYYMHAPSALSLARNRAYSASLSRWISRDPIEESGGSNLYSYCKDEPVNHIDPLGLFMSGVISKPEPAESDDDATCSCPMAAAAGGGGQPPEDPDKNNRELQQAVRNSEYYQNCIAGVDTLMDSIADQYKQQQIEDYAGVKKGSKKWKCLQNKWRIKWQQWNDDQAERYSDCYTSALENLLLELGEWFRQ